MYMRINPGRSSQLQNILLLTLGFIKHPKSPDQLLFERYRIVPIENVANWRLNGLFRKQCI